jgi:hypothetical protein
LTSDGRLALIDLGMVARVSPQLQDALVRLLLALSEGHGSEVAAVMAGLGEKRESSRSSNRTKRWSQGSWSPGGSWASSPASPVSAGCVRLLSSPC